MYKNVELFYEPLHIKNDAKINCEMSDFQLAFLCGILKNKKPRKIVEVGVAYGGTTCVILECLRLLDYNVEMHSVDISKEYYRNPSQRTGYAVDEIFNVIPNNIEHHWHLGYSLPEVIEDIGTGIDILILDTVHSMPGEMLDFLAAFHYLSKGAVVVLHDIILNQISDNEYGYATKIVYDVVVADKLIAEGEDDDRLLPNIGAFEINEDTGKYIERCFSALTITWKYILEDKYMELYRELYRKHYDTYLVDIFDKAYMLNVKRTEKETNRKQSEQEQLIRFHNFISDGYKVVLYGAGDYAFKIGNYLSVIGHECDAYVISDGDDIEKCKIKENVYHYSELPYLQEECNVIMALHPAKQDIVLEKLTNNSFHQIFSGNYYLYSRLLEYIDNYMKFMDYYN
jgi:predicted O-methyltransferase YrrM